MSARLCRRARILGWSYWRPTISRVENFKGEMVCPMNVYMALGQVQWCGARMQGGVTGRGSGRCFRCARAKLLQSFKLVTYLTFLCSVG